jgi:hypothetical protein
MRGNYATAPHFGTQNSTKLKGSHIGSMSKLKHHPAVASWTVLKEGHGVGRN